MTFCSSRRPLSPLPRPSLLPFALLWIFVAPHLPAQETSQAEAPIATLHAYADLIQIPVLVLDHHRQFVPKVDTARVSITLDSGRPFRPTYIRPEGEDPIALSILLDVRDLNRQGLRGLEKAISELGAGSLRPHDKVNIYALDCSLHHVTTVSTPGPAFLSRSAELVLQPWRSHVQQTQNSDCAQPIELWDTIYYLTDQLRRLPGRRIIIALSSGIDRGSRLTWNETKTYAQVDGVSVFGVRYAPSDAFNYSHSSSNENDFFNSVCELSGGIVLRSNDDDMPGTFKRILQMIRDRYIIEFPRPRTASAGAHAILVSVAKSDAFIRPGGISVPLPDPAMFTNPAVPPPDPLKTPEFGTRRILLPAPPSDRP